MPNVIMINKRGSVWSSFVVSFLLLIWKYQIVQFLVIEYHGINFSNSNHCNPFLFFIRKGKNEISEQTTEDVIDSAYTEAYKLVIKQKKDVNEVDHILESKGLDESQ